MKRLLGLNPLSCPVRPNAAININVNNMHYLQL